MGNQAKLASLLSILDTLEPLHGNTERLKFMMLQSLSRTLNHHPSFSLISIFKVIAKTTKLA